MSGDALDLDAIRIAAAEWWGEGNGVAEAASIIAKVPLIIAVVAERDAEIERLRTVNGVLHSQRDGVDSSLRACRAERYHDRAVRGAVAALAKEFRATPTPEADLCADWVADRIDAVLAPVSGAVEGDDCASCGEIAGPDCARSQRSCGHHCNHSWDQDVCHWCGATFGETGAEGLSGAVEGAGDATVGEDATEVLARAIHPEGVRADGTPSLLLALLVAIEETIGDVIADTGDNTPTVLASNIATRLSAAIKDALPASPVAGHEQEVRANEIEHADKHSLWTALDALNEAGQEPTIAGVDAEGRAFLAYLAEEGGDATCPGIVFDEPHQTAYGMHGDQDCDECGCPRRRWTLDDLKYPVRILAARSSGSSAPVQGGDS